MLLGGPVQAAIFTFNTLDDPGVAIACAKYVPDRGGMCSMYRLPAALCFVTRSAYTTRRV